jgi:S-adenosylmethionine:tRNA ribosyltransferase-isomerase
LETATFDFDLPDHLIAQRPVEPRDQSRLMVLRVGSRTWEHRTFADLPELLRPDDLLVLNNTRVVPARLFGHRESTGGQWEGLFLRALPDGSWEMLATTRGRPAIGETIVVEGGLRLELLGRGEKGRWLVKPISADDPPTLLARHGHVPLPPYIRKGRDDPADRLRYQTIYARQPGAVAAPTAGLHFTEDLFQRLRGRGIDSAEVTLHVGLGTFRPIESERIDEHVLHAEWAEVFATTADTLNSRRESGGRIVAVGTTSARTLETSAQGGRYEAISRETSLYLMPGHRFRGVDALITNFHLPRSSLLVLVSALAGVEFVREAYAEAIREEYRFYSYGDAMLVLPDG